MEISTTLQLQQAAIALASGLAAAFFYDLLAVLRAPGGAVRAFVLDALFGLALGAGLFVMGCGPGRGELRLFMPAFLLAGMGLYFLLLGGRIRRCMGKLYALAVKTLLFLLTPLKKLKKICKKVGISAKKLFKNKARWFKLYGRPCVPSRAEAQRTRKDKVRQDESEKSGFCYETGYPVTGALHRGDACQYAWPHRSGRAAAGAAGLSGKAARRLQRRSRV